jgi:hypothetical protein
MYPAGITPLVYFDTEHVVADPMVAVLLASLYHPYRSTINRVAPLKARLGGRLCTQTEIIDGVGKATGCSFDSQFVWTSTKCTLLTTTITTTTVTTAATGAGALIGPGAIKGYVKARVQGGESECRTPGENGPLRCCSDVVV